MGIVSTTCCNAKLAPGSVWNMCEHVPQVLFQRGYPRFAAPSRSLGNHLPIHTIEPVLIISRCTHGILNCIVIAVLLTGVHLLASSVTPFVLGRVRRDPTGRLR